MVYVRKQFVDVSHICQAAKLQFLMSTRPSQKEKEKKEKDFVISAAVDWLRA